MEPKKWRGTTTKFFSGVERVYFQIRFGATVREYDFSSANSHSYYESRAQAINQVSWNTNVADNPPAKIPPAKTAPEEKPPGQMHTQEIPPPPVTNFT